jgi:hypothetical protein
MKKTKKNLRKLTADEALAHVFHPDAVKHIKEHIDKMPIPKRKLSKKES